MQKLDWDWGDIGVFLTVLREGSTLRAAQKLGINQTTCARRITALEAAFDLKLFEKAASGYQPTPAAIALRDAAERMESAASAFESRAIAQARNRRRVLRVTASTYYADPVAAAIRRLREQAPEVLVETDLTDTVRDLHAGEADLAIRGGQRPGGEGLIMRQLWSETGCVACSESYIQQFGAPTAEDFASHAWVMLSGPAFEMAVDAGLGSSIRQVVNSIDGLVAALKSGAFIGILPDTILRSEQTLRHCFDVPFPDIGAWIVFPERWRDDADHVLLRDVLAEEMLVLRRR